MKPCQSWTESDCASVKTAIINGEVIEAYPDDFPYPSCLISGLLCDNYILHIVCGIGENELWIISAYRPDPERWMDDFTIRKGAL